MRKAKAKKIPKKSAKKNKGGAEPKLTEAEIRRACQLANQLAGLDEQACLAKEGLK